MRLWAGLFRIISFTLLAGFIYDSCAQAFPTKPVRYIVPFTAGGGADATARMLAAGIGDHLGQQVVVENRGGVGGIVGSEFVARAVPDGHILLLGTANLAMSVSLFSKLPFNPTKDFRCVSVLVRTPSIVAVHPSLPVKSIRDLIALAKANPGKIDYAGGAGSTLQFGTELLNVMAKINLVHVPYNGTGPALIAAMSGEAPVIIAPGALVPYIKSGKLRGIAITSKQRSPALPDLPTVAESGLPGYEVSQWYGVLAPAATPEPVVARLNSEFVKSANMPDIKARFISEASEVVGSTPDECAANLKAEIEKWAKVVKSAGIHVE